MSTALFPHTDKYIIADFFRTETNKYRTTAFSEQTCSAGISINQITDNCNTDFMAATIEDREGIDEQLTTLVCPPSLYRKTQEV